jgi:hypothetical protein
MAYYLPLPSKLFSLAFEPLKPSDHCMYHQFNIHKFYVLSTQCIYVFCVDLRKKQRLFPHTALADWFFKLRWSVFTGQYGLRLCIRPVYFYFTFHINTYRALQNPAVSL